jgi:hypothetical protein
MSNFRVIFDNATDRASLAVSSWASESLGGANLFSDYKGEVWRAASKTATITLSWGKAEFVGGVLLPYANLTAEATVRVRLFAQPDDVEPVLDTGTILACPGATLDTLAWGVEALGVNAYSYAGSSCGRAWFNQAPARRVEITISDENNPAGYIEVGRLVTGRYWEGERNVDYDPQLTLVDSTNNTRSDAGDLLSDVGTKSRKLSLGLSNLSPAERKTLWGLLAGNGRAKPIFFSLFPDHEDTSLEQTYQMYCKVAGSPAMRIPSFLQYTSSLELEEV